MRKRIAAYAIVAIMILCIIPVPVFATNDESFEPKQTNEYYEGMIKGVHSEEFDYAIEGLDYDDSILWGMTGASRALLVISLANDLEEYDKKLYENYISGASKYYVGITPKIDDKYMYAVCYVDGKNSILLVYVPGTNYCGYSEVNDFSQENLDAIALMTEEIWEITEDDFSEMMKMIGDAENTYANTLSKHGIELTDFSLGTEMSKIELLLETLPILEKEKKEYSVDGLTVNMYYFTIPFAEPSYKGNSIPIEYVDGDQVQLCFTDNTGDNRLDLVSYGCTLDEASLTKENITNLFQEIYKAIGLNNMPETQDAKVLYYASGIYDSQIIQLSLTGSDFQLIIKKA